MKEYIERKAVLDSIGEYCGYVIRERVNAVPAADVVPRNAYNAIRWERDIMEKQLADIGKSLGQKMDDVQPVKHGKWILKSQYESIEEYPEQYWECSLCGCGSDSFDTVYHTNYCPNCGARMDGE